MIEFLKSEISPDGMKSIRLMSNIVLSDAQALVFVPGAAREWAKIARESNEILSLHYSSITYPLREVVDELRRTLPGVRVIYVSGYPNDVLGERGIAGPGDELLSKPFPPQALLARLRHALDTPPAGDA